MSDEIEKRLKRLEARNEILDLKHRYQLLCDQGYDPDGIAELFIEDGWWQTTGFGRHEGREAIRAFMAAVSGDIPWAWHVTANGLVEISEDGESATGRWHSLVICEARGEDGTVRPRLMIGKYRDEFRRVDGRWLFKSVEVTLERSGDLDAQLEQPEEN